MKRLLAALSLVACGGAIDPSTPPTSVTYTFAMQHFFIDVKRDTTFASNDAWKDYGRNIDAKITTADSIDVCQLFPNGDQVDGTNGIDNAFGETLVPTWETEGSVSDNVSYSIQHGTWTIQFQILGLSDDPAQTSSGLVARVFSSGQANENPPAFDETTSWPVLSTSVADGQTIASGAVATFPNASITHGHFDSGAATRPLPFRFDLNGAKVDLVLHEAKFTFDHASREGAVHGIVSGVLDLDELLATAQAIASHISPQLCGTGFDPIAAQLRAAADILRDGTNVAGASCDGISLGFGFDAKLIASPTEVAEAATVENVCP